MAKKFSVLLGIVATFALLGTACSGGDSLASLAEEAKASSPEKTPDSSLRTTSESSGGWVYELESFINESLQLYPSLAVADVAVGTEEILIHIEIVSGRETTREEGAFIEELLSQVGERIRRGISSTPEIQMVYIAYTVPVNVYGGATNITMEFSRQEALQVSDWKKFLRERIVVE